jgi:hypothetical protein
VPVRLIFGKLALPCADGKLKGCWWRKHHFVVLDGSTLALQDTAPQQCPFRLFQQSTDVPVHTPNAT